MSGQLFEAQIGQDLLQLERDLRGAANELKAAESIMLRNARRLRELDQAITRAERALALQVAVVAVLFVTLVSFVA